MPQPWEKPLIRSRQAECMEILEEIAEAGDLDLWEEAAAKLTDVVVVYRRAQRGEPEPTTYTFSDGVTRDLSRMAFDHAYAHEFPDWDGEEPWPKFLERDKTP